MDISNLTLGVLLLGLPGIMAYFVAARLTGKRARTNLELILAVFVLTVIAYVVDRLMLPGWRSLGIQGSGLDLVAAMQAESVSISLSELVRATVAGVVVAYLVSASDRLSVLNIVGQRLGVTNRYGDEDVWHYWMNAPDDEKNKGWVLVRDHDHDLMYYGWISVWSDSGQDREVIVSDALVYRNSTGARLYDAKHVYVCRAKEALSIEVPIENVASTSDATETSSSRET